MELPRLESLYAKYKDRGFEIVAVEAFRMEDLARKFIEENKLTYHFVQDGADEKAIVGKIYKVFGFPTTFVVDRNGRIMYSHLGFSPGDEATIEKEILSLM
ncbi:MAG: TlpA family protein disulfide reductase [Chitinivibrionia bacterium]|nr:TlpA family protein disulfide reductase [Chitinivibrionia bacterium]